MAVVTRTGLSPEFHLANGNSGTAGAFLVRGALLFVDRNQSVNNHRSNERLLLLLLLTWILLLLLVSFVLSSRAAAVIISSGSAPLVVLSVVMVVVVVVGAASRNSSRYSLTGPLTLEMANLVLDTGTTCVFQTMAATMLMTTTILMPINTCGSGRMASKCCCNCCDCCCCIVLDNSVGDMVVVDVAIHVEVQDDVAEDADDDAAWMKGD